MRFTNSRASRVVPLVGVALLTSGFAFGTAGSASAASDPTADCIGVASYPQSDGTAYGSINCANSDSINVNIYEFVDRDGHPITSTIEKKCGTVGWNPCSLDISYSTGGAYGSHQWCTTAVFIATLLGAKDTEVDCITEPGGAESYRSTGWISGGSLR